MQGSTLACYPVIVFSIQETSSSAPWIKMQQYLETIKDSLEHWSSTSFRREGLEFIIYFENKILITLMSITTIKISLCALYAMKTTTQTSCSQQHVEAILLGLHHSTVFIVFVWDLCTYFYHNRCDQLTHRPSRLRAS